MADAASLLQFLKETAEHVDSVKVLKQQDEDEQSWNPPNCRQTPTSSTELLPSGRRYRNLWQRRRSARLSQMIHCSQRTLCDAWLTFILRTWLLKSRLRNLTDDLIEQRPCPLSRVVFVRRTVLSSSRQQRSVSLTVPEGRQVLVPSGPAR